MTRNARLPSRASQPNNGLVVERKRTFEKEQTNWGRLEAADGFDNAGARAQIAQGPEHGSTLSSSGTIERTTWRKILLLRTVHGLFALYFIGCLAVVYVAAFTKVLSGWLTLATLSLAIEAVLVVANRGQCPLTGLQHRLGDNRGFFNLFMPDALARRMVPFWFTVAAIGFLLLWMRR